MGYTFRHIGYYYDLQDVKYLSTLSADEIVKYMRFNMGNFSSVDGERETDIDDVFSEADSNLFSYTTCGEYLVRCEKGCDDGDGWYIDIYKRTEIEDFEDSANDEKEMTYIVCLPFTYEHTIEYLNSLSDKEKYLIASTDKSACIFSSTKDFLFAINNCEIDVNEFIFYEIKVVLNKQERLITYAKQRANESKWTNDFWNWYDLYPLKEDENVFIQVLETCPSKRLHWSNECNWDELLDWFEDLPRY